VWDFGDGIIKNFTKEEGMGRVGHVAHMGEIDQRA
jgi:hypothetical protein